jgi:hypothetical protein
MNYTLIRKSISCTLAVSLVLSTVGCVSTMAIPGSGSRSTGTGLKVLTRSGEIVTFDKWRFDSIGNVIGTSFHDRSEGVRLTRVIARDDIEAVYFQGSEVSEGTPILLMIVGIVVCVTLLYFLIKAVSHIPNFGGP